MSKKFIPNGDLDFWTMANSFTLGLARSPETYNLSQVEADELLAEVAEFGRLRGEAANGTRSQVKTAQKEAARVSLERRIRQIAGAIRANKSLEAVALINVGMRERSKSGKPESLTNQSPDLRFERAHHNNNEAPEHQLTFFADRFKPRAPGAVRLELFVDLIPPEMRAEEYNTRKRPARPLYLRSYNKSPIRLVPPMADRAMRVVYFARWADADGNVGPLSHPAMGWVEGGTHHLMIAVHPSNRPARWIGLDDETQAHQTTVVVAMVTASTLAAAKQTPLIEQADAMPQLEGPDALAA